MNAAIYKPLDSCSACYGYLIPALDRLEKEGLLSGFPEKICIGQGYRGKSGKLGIGNCTKDFRYSLKTASDGGKAGTDQIPKPDCGIAGGILSTENLESEIAQKISGIV